MIGVIIGGLLTLIMGAMIAFLIGRTAIRRLLAETGAPASSVRTAPLHMNERTVAVLNSERPEDRQVIEGGS